MLQNAPPSTKTGDLTADRWMQGCLPQRFAEQLAGFAPTEGVKEGVSSRRMFGEMDKDQCGQVAGQRLEAGEEVI